MTFVWHLMTSSLWWHLWWVRLEPLTLHDASKSLSVWVRLLPIGPKDHMQKGYCVTCPSLLPMGGRGKFLSVWIRLGMANRPHAKEVLYGCERPCPQQKRKILHLSFGVLIIVDLPLVFYNAKNKKKLKKDMNNIKFSCIWTITIDRNI